VLASSVAIAGCVSWTPAQAAIVFQRESLDVASFDLGCPKDKISVQGLSTPTGMFPGSVVGVTGCGKKTTYVGTNNGAWVKNSETIAAP
jgi:hypothetical protein